MKTSNRGRCTIDSYVHDCDVIWGHYDSKRPVSDIYYYVTFHASKLGEALRRQRYDIALHELGRTTIWLLSFVSRLQHTKADEDGIFHLTKPLSEILWEKYPNCCPVCYGEKCALPRKRRGRAENWAGKFQPCTCLLRLRTVEERNQQLSDEDKEYIRAELRSYAQSNHFNPGEMSLNHLQARFGKIYEALTVALSIENMGFHLLEEIGEIAEALTELYTYGDVRPNRQERERRTFDLEGEIADAFSWIFGLSNKLIAIFSIPDRTAKTLGIGSVVKVSFARNLLLSNVIWQIAEYGSKDKGILVCRKCKEPKCSCSIHLLTTRHSTQGR